MGAFGGLWAQAFLLPYLSSHEAFHEWSFVKEWSERTTVIREIQEVTITQEEAIAKTVERGQEVAVAVQSASGGSTVSGSGLILTSDGFLVTVADAVPAGYDPAVYFAEGQEPVQAQVLKRDTERNLVLLKVERGNLPSLGFASPDSLRLGDTVVMTAKVMEGGELVRIAQEGTVRTKSPGVIRTNIFDKQTLQGSPLFNLEGQIVGVNMFDSTGRLVAISTATLREFSGF